ncbi:MAG: hypothetical protein WC483_04985 [Candidatus Paceibacterota bacterium]
MKDHLWHGGTASGICPSRPRTAASLVGVSPSAARATPSTTRAAPSAFRPWGARSAPWASTARPTTSWSMTPASAPSSTGPRSTGPTWDPSPRSPTANPSAGAASRTRCSPKPDTAPSLTCAGSCRARSRADSIRMTEPTSGPS